MVERHEALPPGQILTQKFPVVGEKAPPAAALDLDSWRLTLNGLVATPLEWSYRQFLDLPQADRQVDIHCVTGWSRHATVFTGVPLSRLLDQAGIAAKAAYVRFAAYSDRDHDTTLPLELALADTWLVHSRDGQPLQPEHGFPLRTISPSRYFYKSLKWLRRIELLAEDRLGYWERESAYHNNGDPWPGDQRFTTGSLRPDQFARFKAATSYQRWRRGGKVLLGLNLRQWQPATLQLSGLQLKNCDLRGARLAGADLRQSNLSLSDLAEADLQRADLSRSDLEGASFCAADLTGADLSSTALSATRFVEQDGSQGARVRGMKVAGASGLLEAQEAYLRDQGAEF